MDRTFLKMWADPSKADIIIIINIIIGLNLSKTKIKSKSYVF